MLPALAVALVATSTSVPPGSELVRDVTALIAVRSATAPSFSPDGSRMAFVSNITGTPQVWTVSVDGGWPNLVTNFDDPVASVSWASVGNWIAVQVAPGGGMNQQVWRMRPDGSEARRLTPGGKETNELFGWDHTGRRLLLSSNARDAAATDIYVLPADASELGRPALEGKGINSAADLSQDGARLLVDRLISRGSNDLLLRELATGKETLLTPHEGPGNFAGLLSPDGRTVWLSSDRDRDFAVFGKIRIGADGSPGAFETVVERPDVGLSFFDIDEQGKHALLVWNVAGRSELTLLDLRTGKSRPVPALPVDVVSNVTHTRDGRRWGLVTTAANRPTDIWVLDTVTLKARQLTRSSHPGVALETARAS